MFTTETIAAMAVGGLLALIIPIGAAVIFKLKNRETWLPSVFIGAGTFFVFAMILEQLLHAVMLPIVQGSKVLYCVYGAFAAGVFEETGRFIAYKTLMRKHYSTKNAVYTGIGHGGCEAILLLGMTMLSNISVAASVNTLGIDEFVKISSAGNPELAETVRSQVEAISAIDFAVMGQSIYERVLAMVFHVCMSVIVYKAASQRGKVWLYPCAVVLHALLDVPAVLYQTGVLTGIPAVHGIMTAFTAVVVVGTAVLAKKLPDKNGQQNARL